MPNYDKLDKQGNPKATTPQEFHAKRDANKGQWRDPEKARAAAMKGVETRQKRAAMKKKLQNKQAMIDDAMAAAMEDNEDFFEETIKTLMGIVTGGGSTDQDKLKALAALSDLTGARAAKQTEVKVEHKEMEPEEAQEILNSLKVIK